jgi:hypothetical protein
MTHNFYVPEPGSAFMTRNLRNLIDASKRRAITTFSTRPDQRHKRISIKKPIYKAMAATARGIDVVKLFSPG